MKQSKPEGDDQPARVEILRLFERSQALQTAVSDVLAQAIAPSARRELLATSIGVVSLEHWCAQRLLLREGLYVTGFALVRLQFEAVIRTIWILECAKDDWLERFVTPMADGQLKEPELGLPVSAMLSAIAAKAPVIAGMLSQLKEGAWEPMHSYVHGGVRPMLIRGRERRTTSCQQSSGMAMASGFLR